MSTHRCFHDEKERRKWQNPEKILVSIGLGAGLTFMDIGCGDGFFAIPAAKLVGKTGKVYALDVSPEAINWLKKKAAEEGLSNIVPKVGRAEDTIFCETCADIVFFALVLHDFNDPVKVLMNAWKMLKATGLLVDLDWKKEPMELGPPLRIRFSQEEAIHYLESADFKIDVVKDSGLYHYIIVSKP